MKIAKWTNQHHQQQLKSEKGDALKNSHILKWNDYTIDDKLVIFDYLLINFKNFKILEFCYLFQKSG